MNTPRIVQRPTGPSNADPASAIAAAIVMVVAVALVLTLLIGSCMGEGVSQATGPQQIDPGNLLVIEPAQGSQKWVIMPHEGGGYSLYRVVIAADGQVAVTVHELPIGQKDPGDPPPPPPPPAEDLKDLVRKWADEINDPTNRITIGAAYRATTMMIDNGQITSLDRLKTVHKQFLDLILSEAVRKAWAPFFTRLDEHLSRHPPADLAAAKTAFLKISDGLAAGVTDTHVLHALESSLAEKLYEQLQEDQRANPQ